MAVFTPLRLDELQDWIQAYDLGAAHGLRGISSGIENSNFFIDTARGEFVLTIFETLPFERVPYYLHLMRHLALHGVKTPEPQLTRQGEILLLLKDKPACIVSKLEGASQMAPGLAHCAACGEMLARMHLAGRDFPLRQQNLRDLDWMRGMVEQVLPFLDQAQRHLLLAEMHFQDAFAASNAAHHLKRGPVHLDLFRNNVMFQGNVLGGFFDFYFAGDDAWLYDLAITVNDWCIALDSGALDAARCHAMLQAYQTVRPFDQYEQQAWPALLRLAALRFWISRLFDFHRPRPAEELTPHDPAHFERVLRMRIAHGAAALPVES
ncbi:homoserine kinase [Massilia sp. W12]|uniref:homoserine kinase n=1 Tax=Massilia sp. W12 TaxID=3126507 RepID=UPI0030D5136E